MDVVIRGNVLLNDDLMMDGNITFTDAGILNSNGKEIIFRGNKLVNLSNHDLIVIGNGNICIDTNGEYIFYTNNNDINLEMNLESKIGTNVEFEKTGIGTRSLNINGNFYNNGYVEIGGLYKILKVDGDFNNTGTLYKTNLEVAGDIQNQGVIDNSMSGIYVKGNIINNGIWEGTNASLVFPSGNKTYLQGNNAIKVGMSLFRPVQLQSDFTFESGITFFDNNLLIVPSPYTLTIANHTTFYKVTLDSHGNNSVEKGMHITGTGKLLFAGTGMIRIEDIRVNTAEVRISPETIVTGYVSYPENDTFEIHGHLINEGILRGDQCLFCNDLDVKIAGDLEHLGTGDEINVLVTRNIINQGVFENDSKIFIVWESIPDAVSYDLHFCGNEGQGQIIFDIVETKYEITDKIDQIWEWDIRAKIDDGNYTEWGDKQKINHPLPSNELHTAPLLTLKSSDKVSNQTDVKIQISAISPQPIQRVKLFYNCNSMSCEQSIFMTSVGGALYESILPLANLTSDEITYYAYADDEYQARGFLGSFKDLQIIRRVDPSELPIDISQNGSSERDSIPPDSITDLQVSKCGKKMFLTFTVPYDHTGIRDYQIWYGVDEDAVNSKRTRKYFRLEHTRDKAINNQQTLWINLDENHEETSWRKEAIFADSTGFKFIGLTSEDFAGNRSEMSNIRSKEEAQMCQESFARLNVKEVESEKSKVESLKREEKIEWKYSFSVKAEGNPNYNNKEEKL